MANPYEQDLGRQVANYQPLTPISYWSAPPRLIRIR